MPSSHIKLVAQDSSRQYITLFDVPFVRCREPNPQVAFRTLAVAMGGSPSFDPQNHALVCTHAGFVRLFLFGNFDVNDFVRAIDLPAETCGHLGVDKGFVLDDLNWVDMFQNLYSVAVLPTFSSVQIIVIPNGMRKSYFLNPRIPQVVLSRG